MWRQKLVLQSQLYEDERSATVCALTQVKNSFVQNKNY